MNNYPTKNQGFLLASLLIVTFFVMAAGLVTAQLAFSNLQLATVEYYRVNAQFAADAGLDHAIQNLNQDHDWPGSGGEVILYEDSKNKITFQTTITNDPADEFKKYLTVVGSTYAPKTSAEPRIERKFAVALRAVSGGNFSLVTGVGGLIMSNNAKIVGGNVYVNGNISLLNSAQIGLTSNTVLVRAAHQSCPIPADATYPRVCAAGENGQPITTSVQAKIYGEVQATNQTNGTNMSDPGLVAGDPPPAALPTHDRAALKAAISSMQTAAAAGCNNGTKTWPANLKITGDVTVRGTCKVTVEGDVWITGSLSVSNSAELIVKNGLTVPPVLMIDGQSGLSQSNAAILRSNSNPNPLGFRVVTYWSVASCSPECADVTGADLYNSRNSVTIQLSNSSSGAQTEFYARWTRVRINNSGNVGALVGQTVEISNSGTITFGANVTGVTSIEAWVVDSYRRTF